jgi:predicted extracellular nuclease
VVTLRGIVTGDTAHIGISPLNPGGSNAWYMQTGNQPWSGIWVTGIDTTLKKIRNGDSVSVTGTVQENFDVTTLGSVTTPVTVLASGISEPAPVVLTTGAFGPNVGNGFASAEPYEGMLVKFNNVTVTDTTSWVFSDRTEFAVADNSGSPILVRRDGRNTYTNVPAESTTTTPKKVLRPGSHLSSLTGVMYYSFNRYKILPRTDADFGTVTSVDINREPVVPVQYALGQNYPNPFNPSTLIVYDLPTAGLVTVNIYNVLGQEVRTLVHEVQTAGRYTVRFNGTSLPSGVYFYRLQAGAFSQAKKMLMVK